MVNTKTHNWTKCQVLVTECWALKGTLMSNFPLSSNLKEELLKGWGSWWREESYGALIAECDTAVVLIRTLWSALPAENETSQNSGVCGAGSPEEIAISGLSGNSSPFVGNSGRSPSEQLHTRDYVNDINWTTANINKFKKKRERRWSCQWVSVWGRRERQRRRMVDGHHQNTLYKGKEVLKARE